ncbi:hypothetical protein BX666DRAFT_1847844 [Dichotomocladium elegans]|nr:hypothetical protein BX666DRAFT_1847844 [Dichotomocladium elegans]
MNSKSDSSLQLKHRSSSYQRLKAKLKRNPSSFQAINKEAWPRPETPKEVLLHALKGGARAFLLAFGVRGGVILCLSLLRVMRKGGKIGHLISTSFKNETALRFGAMFGTFAFLWKLVNNGMRIQRDKDDRLNGLVAGAVAGLAILCERQERRVDIAQQLDILYFKNGDALLFALACGQILYSYTMQPHTLDPGYYKFMVATARVPGNLLRLSAKNVRGFPITPEETLKAISIHRPTPHAIAIASTISAHPVCTPCEALHPWIDGCSSTAVERFVKVCKSMFPVYGTLHFVPMLLLRNKHLRKDPQGMLKRTALATIKSCAMMGVFVTLYQMQVCTHRNLVKAGLVRTNSKYLYGIFGFVCSFVAIFLEEKKRRGELAMYCLPIALKSAYQIAYQRKWIIHIKHFEVLMTSVAMAVIMVRVCAFVNPR